MIVATQAIPSRNGLSEVFERAQALHQSGKFREAESLYQQLIDRAPQDAEIRFQIGDLYQAQGRHAEAIPHYQEGLRLRPSVAEAHFRLGCALAGAGRKAEAVEHYRQVLRLCPDHADAHATLGVILAELNMGENALAHLREAVRLRPHFAPVHQNLGVALAQQQQYEAALACLREAVRLEPNYAEAHGSIGNVLMQLKKREEAAASYREALRIKPNHVDTYNNLGLALREIGRMTEAAVILRQAVRLRPDAPAGHNNLALILSHMGRYEEAEASFHEALRLKPDYVEAHINLGSNYKEQARTEEALACYEVALWHDSESITAHWNRSLAWLQMGDLERGWPEYEWRWKRPETPPRFFRQPRWDGSSLRGRTILLYTEQGLGDTIQFVRYSSLLKRQNANVVLECPGFMIPLLSRCPGIDKVIPENSAPPEFDVHAPLMSLPGLTHTMLANIPAEIPYLFPDPGLVEEWARRLKNVEGFKIGIVWQGNPHHGWDRYRSVALQQFAPIAQVEGVHLLSLQKGPGREQLQTPAGFKVTQIVDGELMTPTGAFSDTAAAIMNLDLVITVDTAPAHLAGALGRPVWVVLATLVDWRWLLEREDTPWYPTMRLFRQKRLGDWKTVFEQMAEEVYALVNRGSRGRLPC